ncbi:MAG TPA: hypothetical protein VGQ46_21565 [Thermoanaerobaculia bacterium]|jgi:hypothetical protein|nr:hypothetical protein [Thermoanaerobaculia bacterium]
MDIIVWPDQLASMGAKARLLTTDGMQHLASYAGWFSTEENEFDVYALLPEGDDELLEDYVAAIATSLPPFAGTFYFVLPASRLEPGLLPRLEASGASAVIVTVSSDLDDETVEEKAAILAGHLAEQDEEAASGLLLGIWMEPVPGQGNVDRARVFELAGIDASSVAVSRLTFRTPDILSGIRVADTPAELLTGSRHCALYDNSITVDAAGNLRHCTRDDGRKPIANVIDDSPDDFLTRKARHSLSLPSNDMCLSCRMPARFVWPERKTATIHRLYAMARHDKRVANILGVNVLEHHNNLSAAAAEDVDETLEQFGARLDDWRRKSE